jgi:CBS domain-containing protein
VSRRDAHFDAMLRHLGAAYYQSVQGIGSAAAVTSAVGAVAAADGDVRPVPGGGPAPARWQPGRRWCVRDVMVTDVATVPMTAAYREIAALMTARLINAVPVVDRQRCVIGMVSAADMLRKQERRFGRAGTGPPRRARRQRAQAAGLTAAQLMTAPPITIHPDAPLGAAARQLNGHHIRRMPVVDESGRLLGIVSRRDLLRVFLRPDDDIAADVRAMMSDILLEDPGKVSVSVHDGTIRLSGMLGDPGLAPAAIRLAGDIDGAIAVIDDLDHEPALGRFPG